MPKKPRRLRFETSSYHKKVSKRGSADVDDHNYCKVLLESESKANVFKDFPAVEDVAETPEVEATSDEVQVLISDDSYEIADDVSKEKLIDSNKSNEVSICVLEHQINNDSESFLDDSESNGNDADFLKKTGDFLHEVAGALKNDLPPYWEAQMSSHGLHIVKYSTDRARVIQRSVVVTHSRSVHIYVHGHELPTSHPAYSTAKTVNIDGFDVDCVASSLKKVVVAVRLFDVCVGASKTKYNKFWKGKDVRMDYNSFHEIRYQITCRSVNCLRIIDQRKRLCIECSKLSKRFMDRAKPSTPSKKVNTPHKFKPHTACNTPEKAARLAKYQKELKNLRRRNERLKLKTVIENEGVDIDDQLDGGLSAIVDEQLLKIDKELENSDNLTPEQEEKLNFQKIFLEQQVQARQKRDGRGIRWHPLIIRFALQIKMISTAAYTAMRDNGFVQLPSLRTLYDYTHAMDMKDGCHDQIIQETAENVSKLEYKYQEYHVLTMDEVHICENIVQRKSTGEMIGYCKLDAVQEEFLKLGRKLKDQALKTTSAPLQTLPAAKKILSFMVKGVASNVESVVASYCVSSLTKEDLYMHTWEVIEKCEVSGIKVLAVVCDGSAVNRGFIDMHPPTTKLTSGTVFDTVNPFDLDRNIYFISDPPHLIKTVRNCFSKSGRMKNRKLKKNGQFILWETIEKLYKLKSDQTIKKLYKLEAACVYLNSFSCMKVRYAARVLSRSVANAIISLKWTDLEETCVFK